MIDKSTKKKFIVMIRYFIDYSSPLIIHYFREFLAEYEYQLELDDEFFRKI
jgi:hypothetical protein